MSPRAASRISWTLSALAILTTAAVVGLASMNAGQSDDLSFAIVGVSSAVVGGVVASRRPENIVGWFFLAGALLSALRALGGQYAIYGLITAPGSLPLSEVAAWFWNATSFLGPVFAFILIPLYFPTGYPVTPRWRIVTWAAVGMLPPATLLAAFAPGEALSGTGIQNPLALDAFGPLNDALGPLLFAWYIGLIVAAAFSLVARFRRARGEERQQIKWFTYAAAFIPVWFLTNKPIEEAFPGLFSVLDALVIAAVPVAAGIAILRYRLYDIDRIINRTLVYAALTAMLLGIYLGSVVLLQTVVGALAGTDSQLVIVASTLGIAALFSPLRRVIQTFIDRRFYRQKYDARETLETFSRQLRGETDLDALGEGLVVVARKTMRPEHASLLLLPPTRELGGRHG